MRYLLSRLLLFELLLSAFIAQAQNCQITGPTFLCADVEGQYQLNHQISHVVGVDWAVTGGSVVTQSFTGATVLWEQSGNQTIVATIHQSNGNLYFCQLTVSVLPSPEVPPLPDFSICPGDEREVSTPACNGCTYLWSVQGLTGASINPPNASSSTLSFSTPGQGQYCVTVTNIIGCSNTSCADVTVVPVTNIPVTVSGAAPTGIPNDWEVCPNQSVVFSVPVKGMAWEISDGTNTWNFSGEEISFQFPTPGATVYTVTATGTSVGDGQVIACSAIIPQTIHVLSADPIPISCPSVVCEGDAITYTVPAGCTGTWEVSPQGTIQGTPTSQSVTVIWSYNAADPDGYVIYNGTCSGACPAPSIVEVPIIPVIGTMTGPSIICNPGFRNYSVQNIPGATYSWSHTTHPNVIGPQYNNFSTYGLTFEAGFTGSITVSVTVNHPIAGCSYEVSKVVTYSPLTGTIDGDRRLCINEISIDQPYTFSALYPGQLTWTIPPPINLNQTTQAGNHTIIIPANTFESGKSYNLRATNDDGCWVNTAITVAPLLTGEIVGPQEVCPNVSYTYTISPLPSINQTITWTVTQNGAQVSTTTGASVTVSWPPGTGSLSVERTYTFPGPLPLTQCSAIVDQIDLVILPTMPPLQISGDAQPCPDSRQQYSATPSFGSAYTWSICKPDGSPSNLGSIVNGQGSANIEIQWLGVLAPTNLIIKLNASVCGPNSEVTFPITLTPFQFSITLPAICEGDNAVISTTPVVTSASGYSVWVDGREVYLNNPNLSLIPFTFLGIGTHQVRVMIINPNGCEGLFEATSTVTVLPNPTFKIILNAPLPCPTGTSFTRQLFVYLPSPSCTYTWLLGNTQIGTGPSIDITAPGTYKVVSTCGNCPNRSATIEVAYPCCCELDVPGNDFSIDLIKAGMSTSCNSITFGGKIIPTANAYNPRWVIESPSGQIFTQAVVPNPMGLVFGQITVSEVGPYKISLAADERWLDVNIVVNGGQLVFPDFCAFELAGGPAMYPNYQVVPTGLYSYCTMYDQEIVIVPFIARMRTTKVCNANGTFTVTATDNSAYYPGTTSTVEWNYLGQTQAGASISIPGVSSSFELCMFITDQNGYGCEVCETVDIPQQVSVDIDMVNFNVCQGQFTSFIPTITPSGGQSDIIGYHWDFGDGTFSNAMNPQKTYSSPGTYHVVLSAETIYGCIRTASTDLVVNPYSVPVGSIVSQPDDCSTSTLLSFHQTGGTLPETYEWNPGGATSSSITTETNGTYTLLLTTAQGCTAALGIDVSGLAPAFASDITITNRCGGSRASFTAAPGYTYEWAWSPLPAAITPANPTNLADITGTPGIYHVTVTAKQGGMECVSRTFDMEIYAFPDIPQIDQTVSCAGNTYSTTLTITNPPANGFAYWTGSGTIFSNSITVTQNGTYTANFTTSPHGCSSLQNAQVVNSINFSSFLSGCYDCEILDGGDDVYLYGIPGTFDFWSWNFDNQPPITGTGVIAPLLLNSSYHEIVLCVTQDDCTMCSDPFCLVGCDTCGVPAPTIRRIQCLHEYEVSTEYFVHWDFPTDGIVQPCNNTPVTVFNSQNQPVGSFIPSLYEFEQIPGFWHFEGVFTLNTPYTPADVHWNIPFCLISTGAPCDEAGVYPGSFPVSSCDNPNWPDVLCEGMIIEMRDVRCEPDPNTSITHLITLHIEAPVPSTSCNQFALQITSITGDLLYPISGQFYDLTPVGGIISTDVVLGWASNTANDILCLEVDLREDYDCWPQSTPDGKICYERTCVDLTSYNCEDHAPVPTTPYTFSAVCNREKSGGGISVYNVTLTFTGYTNLPNFSLNSLNGMIQGVQVNGNVATFTYVCTTGNLLFYAMANIGANTYVIQSLLNDCGFENGGRYRQDKTNILRTENRLVLQPNPASSLLRIEYAFHREAQEVLTLFIYDSNGRTIQSSEMKAFEGVFDISVMHWSPGIYNVLFKNSKGDILNSKRLVVSSQ